MATKSKQRPSTQGKNAVPAPPATTPDKNLMSRHEIALSPSVHGAIGVHAWSKFVGEVDLIELITGMRERVDKVHAGDMKSVEAMLYGQAMTLQTIFTSLANRVVSQEYLKQIQTFLGLALKAQAQCRATLETLAEIKSPRPVAFVKQANISNGHQQVNNGAQPAQQAGSAQVGGGVESLPPPERGTAQFPTQTMFPAANRIQQTAVAATSARAA